MTRILNDTFFVGNDFPSDINYGTTTGETFEKYFDSTATIQEPTLVADSYGEPIATWTTYDSIPCRLRPITGDKRIAASKDTEFATHKLYCLPITMPINCRIVINNEIYEIKCPSDIMTMGRFMQIDLELIK